MIAITGSGGFIGSHLRERMKEYLVVPKYQTQEALYRFFHEKRVMRIVHLAAYGNHYFQTEEEEVYQANVASLQRLLETAKYLSLEGFYNFSTTYHNLESGTFYGSTKAMGEYLVRAYVAKYNLPVVNIRPVSIYGEHEWEFRFIPTITRKIANGEDITVTPGVAHDWMYVEDFLDGVFSVMDQTGKYKGKSVAIGTGTRIDNSMVAETAMRVIGKQVKIKEGEKREYEVAAYTKKLLSAGLSLKNQVEMQGFGKTPLEEGIRRVYEHPERQLHRA